MIQEIEVTNEESPDLDIGSEVILMDEEIIEEYNIVDETSGDLKGETTEKCTGKGDIEVSKIKEGTYCVFRGEGSLFLGRKEKLCATKHNHAKRYAVHGEEQKRADVDA
ncbi:unnamed protein product [Parnassius apollo]|uniref:(apollo) hypothetical protein n=1 Tax=Parnassius apollo TaxID=110799 RepID=A0A8S3VYI6_PARAO|nr:unnamed protein product [Parnassius apollo]